MRQKQRLPVAVFSTPAAEAVLERTGLSLVDLLRPVSLVNNLNGELLLLRAVALTVGSLIELSLAPHPSNRTALATALFVSCAVSHNR